jgi:DNA polymerase III subunit epsilon
MPIHGLTYDFLKSKPTFKRVVNRFLDFIGDSTLAMDPSG